MAKNWIGEEVGGCKVLKKTNKKDKWRNYFYEVECMKCGAKKELSGKHLSLAKRRNTKSCCDVCDKWIGEEIGGCKVLRKTDKKDKWGRSIYEVECMKCGTKKEVSAGNLSVSKRINIKNSCDVCKSWIGEEVGGCKVLRKTDKKNKWGDCFYEIECMECGAKKEVPSSNLSFAKRENTKSCCDVCKNRIDKKLFKKYGKKIMRKFYNVWDGIISRCYNKSNKNYKDYGGRGITVDEKWRKFAGFADDMLELYIKHIKEHKDTKERTTIDRINNDGPYCKSNCKFATDAEKAENKRNSRKYIVTFPYGKEVEVDNLSKFCREYKLGRDSMARCAQGKRKSHKGFKCRYNDNKGVADDRARKRRA